MLARISVKKPYTVIVGIILVIALGFISFQNMTTDLLPSMDLPYIIVYTTYVGATPEKVESDVTRPLESAFGTLTDIKNITSTSSENLSLVVMEFASGANMDTAMIEISSEIDAQRGEWSDDVGTPVIMKLNPDMLPVSIATVSLDGADLLALSDYVEETIVPRMESVDGVASVTASGVMTQQVDITITQSRIDDLNSAILREVDSELADAEAQLKDAQRQISAGKSKLARARESTYAQIDEAAAALEAGETQLPNAIAQLTAQRDQLSAQLEGARQTLAQLERAVNMTEDEKAQLRQVADSLAALQAQRDALANQLEQLGGATSDALTKQLQDAQSALNEQAALKAQQEKYIRDLQMLDADALRETIANLEADLTAKQAELTEVRAQLEEAIDRQAALNRQKTDLENRIKALEDAQKTAEPTEEPTANPTEQPENTPVPEETVSPTEAPAETDDASILARLFGASAMAEGGAESLDELRTRLTAVQAELENANADVEQLTARHAELKSTVDADEAALKEARDSLDIVNEGEAQLQSRIDAANKTIEGCSARIAELNQEIAELTEKLSHSDEINALTAQIAELDRQILSIQDSDAYKAYLLIEDESALAGQYVQAQLAVSQLEAGINAMNETLDKLNRGIIPAGFIDGVTEDTDIQQASQQLAAARAQAGDGFAQASSALADAEAEIDKAYREFTDKRDEALENAGLDGIITVEMVSQILGAQNLELPAGYVYNADERYIVSIGTKFTSLAELKQVKLFDLGMETVSDVRLLDVADVTISDNSADLFTKVNGENGIMLSFEKQSTSSTSEVAQRITEASETLMQENPDLHIVEMMNQGDYIRLVVDSVLENLVYGGGLAILVLLLFLLDWRPTLIVALSIPASVVVAFVCMYFCNITLNVMSLSGLALGVGMLVDNSIVSIENIYRLRDEEGLPILTASIRGVNQVGGALLSSTLTTICVFLPVVFITGIARDLFSDMGLTIAFALLASLLVAMTVVPSFAATLFKKSRPRKNRLFSALQRGYTTLLKGALRIKWLVLLLALALLAFSLVQVKDMGISFMPTVNSEQMSASIKFSDDSITEDQQQEIAFGVMERMMAIDGVTDVALTSGASISMMSSAGGGGSYSYYMLVNPDSGRKNTEIASEISAACSDLADGESVVLNVQASTMDMSMMIGSGISIDITGTDMDDMRATAVEIAEICRGVAGAKDIDDGSGTTEKKLIVTVDKERARDESLTVAQVYQYIATRLYGKVKLTEAELDGRDYTLYVQEDRNIGISPDDIADMEIEVTGTDKTHFVRIGDIASISYGESFSSISREDQKRKTSVTFSIADGYSANLVQRDLEAKLEGYAPHGECSVKISGENETVMGYMGDLGTMLAVAVLFIFLIMVAQFQSFKSPIIVMFTIPLAFTGGLLMLIITKMDLSIIALVGFLVLSGVVVNNGIVFIDSVNQMRIAGMSKRDALIETGRVRLRPILMTALTTILGMSTMALGTGMGAEMMQPMAIVTIGGLTYATLMTLFVVPALYDIFNGETMRAREIEMMKEAAGMQREGFDDASPAAPAPSAAAPKDVPVTDAEASSDAPAPDKSEPGSAPEVQPKNAEPKPPVRRIYLRK
ncbi:MAG: efflux RND transporter permease subunit [Clostridia bacterium]|nr:efflux RND transporter permease subunit [Clostridia bacterium]